MSKTLLVAGHGPGISQAVAERFCKAGFSVALVARNAGRLVEATARLEAQGYKAAALPADLANPSSVREVVRKARAALGAITVLHWNAAAPVAGDLLTAPAEELATALNAGTVGLVAAVQEALPDMRKRPEAAVLVTNGGAALLADPIDVAAVQGRIMGLAVANAAKHKVSRVLVRRLDAEGVFLAEVMVMGAVKGTAWDQGRATIAPTAVADRFWDLYERRHEHFATVAG
jgi:NAD(P)-dependent dehydrogenase (short-subunit alcohol dehydrogenase family)